MLLHKQTIFHDPSNKIYGDCHRTAIACLLHLPVLEVPHFGQHFLDPVKYHGVKETFLNSIGFTEFSVPFDSSFKLDDVLTTIGFYNPTMEYMISGYSDRDVNHTVLCRGTAMIHDPHPDNTFIIGPCDDHRWWVTTLVNFQRSKDTQS